MPEKNPLETIAEVRALAGQLEESLRKQDDILQMRGMNLPPGAFNALNAMTDNLGKLETRLVEEATELGQLRTLAGTSAQINSSLNLDEVLAEAMDRVIILTGAERGYIILADESENQDEVPWDVRIARDPEQAGGPAVFKGSRTVVKEVLETGKTLLTDNAYNDPRLGANATIMSMNLRSVLCVPLKVKDAVIGAVYVDNRLRAGVFTPKSQTLLTAFANQAAVAVANARLYTDVQDSIQAITELRDLSDNIFTSIGSGVITTDAAGGIVICNPAAIHILDLDTENLLDNPLPDLLPPSEVDFAAEIQDTRQTNQSKIIDAEFNSPTRGLMLLNVTLSPLRNGSTQGITMVLNDLTQERENEEMLRVMRRYLPPEMVDNIHTIAALALGGERRETTCIFVDVRPLATFPPALTPPQIMEMLNQHLSEATNCIHHAGGVIDKYMGHEIMGLFNSQLNPLEDHAARALEAALSIREAFMDLYARMGINPDPHFYRIGIHTGVATLGNVGSEIRRDFTAIGDSINLSKRIEENATAGQIIISEDVQHKIEQIPGVLSLADLQLTQRDAIQVKGRQQLTRIYEVHRA